VLYDGKGDDEIIPTNGSNKEEIDMRRKRVEQERKKYAR